MIRLLTDDDKREARKRKRWRILVIVATALIVTYSKQRGRLTEVIQKSRYAQPIDARLTPPPRGSRATP